MRWEDLAKNVLKNVGGTGIKHVENAIDKIRKSADSPWKMALLDMLANSVEVYGFEGIKKVEKIIDDIAKGKNPDMAFVSLKARSDILAFMQNAEADDKSKAKEFFTIVGEALGVILKAIINGFLK